MKECKEFGARILDFAEGQMSLEEKRKFQDHLKQCAFCQQEYETTSKLINILDQDKVVMPEGEFFENLRTKVRQRVIFTKTSYFPKLVRVLVPVLVAALVLVILYKPQKTIEMSIPVANLLEDEEIASYALSKIVDQEFVNDWNEVEKNFSLEIEEELKALTEQERIEFIKWLFKKYGIES